MIDKDDSGTLDKAEIVDAVKNDKKVIKFLCNCGNQNLQYLLVPSRLDKALAEMDTDRDGTIDADEWEQCIEIALQNKLAARAAKRELDAKNAAKEIEAFTSDFLNAARKCFNLIDKDMSGTLEIDEIIQAVKTDQEVISFLQNCGEENLQFLLQPARLKKALKALDTDGSGEIDVEEWCGTRRPTTARPSTCEDSAELLFSCVWCVVVQNRTTVATTNTHTQRNNRTTASHFVYAIGRDTLPRQLRQPEPPVPVGAGAPRRGAERDGYR